MQYTHYMIITPKIIILNHCVFLNHGFKRITQMTRNIYDTY